MLKGFPANLFVILVGVTYLFAIAESNGTVDWLVQGSVRAVRGHIAAIPWVMFVLSGVLVALGALSPAAVAIIAPIGMAFAARYRINPLMMGLMVVHGSAAGNFSPLGVLGVITNDIVERSSIPASPTVLFLSNAVFNLVLATGVYLVLGGVTLIRERRRAGDDESATANGSPAAGGGSAVGVATRALPATEILTLNRDRTITALGMVGLVVGALIFNLDIGLMAMSLAVLLSALSPESAKNVLSQVSWGVVLLICGIVTYVGLLQAVGTVDFISDSIAGISSPLLAALIICFVGQSFPPSPPRPESWVNIDPARHSHAPLRKCRCHWSHRRSAIATGSLSLDGDRIVFHRNQRCEGDGTCAWRIIEDTLVMNAVAPDECPRRGEALDGPTFNRAD